jgi:hypothetical protein
MLGLVAQHNLQLDVMIAGIDASGGHLFVISHPGNLLPMDTVGSTAIGSGGLHANVRLALAQQAKTVNLVQTIHNVYEAKIASEAAPGVGKSTDMAVINGKGVTFIKEEVYEVLTSIHKERPALSAEDLKALSSVCKEYDDAPAKP